MESGVPKDAEGELAFRQHGSGGRRNNRGLGGSSVGERADSELVRSLRAGDKDAFRELYQRYGPRGISLAIGVLRNRFMAEEVVQEVFLSLWVNSNGFREDRGSVRSWLMSAVHHKAVDLVRREEMEQRRGEKASRDGDVEDEGVEEALAEQAATDDTGVAIRSVLRQIPAEQRQVLTLMYFSGKTQAQVSSELGLPLGTVKSRTLLGMRRLRRLLADDTE